MKEKISLTFFTGGLLFALFFYHLSDEVIIPFILLCLSAALYFYQERAIIIPTKFAVLSLLLLLSRVISGIINHQSYDITSDFALYSALFLMTVFSFSIRHNSREIWYRILTLISIISALLCLFGILEYVSRHIQLRAVGLIEPFYWPSNAASLLLLLFPFAYITFLKETQSTLKSMLFFMLVSLITNAWILSASLFGVLGIFMLILIISTVKIISSVNQSLRRKSLHKVLVFVLFVLVISPNFLYGFATRIIPKDEMSRLTEYFYYDRAESYAIVFREIVSYPYFGQGIHSLSQVMENNQRLPWKGKTIDNKMLQTFAETGIVPFIFEIFLFIYLFSTSLSRIKDAVKESNFMMLSTLVPVPFFLVVGLFSFSYQVFSILVLFAFLSATALEKEKTIEVRGRKVYGILVPLFFLSSTLLINSMILQQGRRLFVGKRPLQSQQKLQFILMEPQFLISPAVYTWLAATAVEQNNYSDAYTYLALREKSGDSSAEMTYQKALLLYKMGKLDESLNLLEKRIKRNPYASPKFYMTLSNLYTEKNDLPQSAYWLYRASHFFPISDSISGFEILLLDSTGYLNPLQSLYYKLYNISSNTKYFNTAFSLITQ